MGGDPGAASRFLSPGLVVTRSEGLTCKPLMRLAVHQRLGLVARRNRLRHRRATGYTRTLAPPSGF